MIIIICKVLSKSLLNSRTSGTFQRVINHKLNTTQHCNSKFMRVLANMVKLRGLGSIAYHCRPTRCFLPSQILYENNSTIQSFYLFCFGKNGGSVILHICPLNIVNIYTNSTFDLATSDFLIRSDVP